MTVISPSDATKPVFLSPYNMKAAFATLALFVLLNPAPAQTGNLRKARIDSAVNQAARAFLTDTTKLALSVGILDGQHMYTYHYGETAPHTGIPPTDHTAYEIGSISKTFTGLLVAHAITEGKMNLNEDIRKYLPVTFTNLQYADGNIIKLGYVLSHTALLPRELSAAWDSNRTEAGFLKGLEDIRLDSLKPNTYNYSSLGYQLLGYILEKMYSLSYDQLLDKYITGPLRMRYTSSPLPNANLIKGYNAQHAAMPYMPAAFPAAGSLKSTVTDMLRYMDYQLHGKDKALLLTHRIIFGNVNENAGGLGWSIGKTWNWDYYYRTDGGTKGFRTFLVLYPDHDLGIVLLTNETDDNAGRKLYDITNLVLKAVKPSVK